MSDCNGPEYVGALMKEYDVWSYVQNLDGVVPCSHTLIVSTQYILNRIRSHQGRDVFEGKYEKYKNGKSLVFNITPGMLEGQSSIRIVFADRESKTITIVRHGEPTECNNLLRDIIIGFSEIQREKLFNSKMIIVHSLEDNSTVVIDLTK